MGGERFSSLLSAGIEEQHVGEGRRCVATRKLVPLGLSLASHYVEGLWTIRTVGGKKKKKDFVFLKLNQSLHVLPVPAWVLPGYSGFLCTKQYGCRTLGIAFSLRRDHRVVITACSAAEAECVLSVCVKTNIPKPGEHTLTVRLGHEYAGQYM